MTVIVMCMVQYSRCHHTCAVGLEFAMKTETKQSQMPYAFADCVHMGVFKGWQVNLQTPDTHAHTPAQSLQWLTIKDTGSPQPPHTSPHSPSPLPHSFCQIVIGTNDQYIPSHTVHVHTLYLLWGTDAMTLKVLDLTEPQEQPRQHIHWNIAQSNMLNTSVNVCRHWVGKQEQS